MKHYKTLLFLLLMLVGASFAHAQDRGWWVLVLTAASRHCEERSNLVNHPGDQSTSSFRPFTLQRYDGRRPGCK